MFPFDDVIMRKMKYSTPQETRVFHTRVFHEHRIPMNIVIQYGDVMKHNCLSNLTFSKAAPEKKSSIILTLSVVRHSYRIERYWCTMPN